MRVVVITLLAIGMGACGGGSAAGSNATTSTAASAGSESSAGTPSDSTQGEHRSGLSLHLQNIHAGGSLPSDADPPVDHLDVTFEMVLNHTGTEPLTGITVQRARIVHDDGREVAFGVMSEGWDGRLDPGQQRTVAFHKTPDSAHPPARQSLCGQHMRLEVTLELAGRTATATSRRVPIECPHAPAG
jgi:hypothetical protein